MRKTNLKRSIIDEDALLPLLLYRKPTKIHGVGHVMIAHYRCVPEGREDTCPEKHLYSAYVSGNS